jgi:transposase
MKAMSKQQLADRAGVSVKTLMNWCQPYSQRLKKMGLIPNAKVLPPNIVKFIAEKFCIEVEG